MVSVRIDKDKAHDVITGCHISGHAEYDDPGYDIVCAAVSAISGTALLGLTQVAEQKGQFDNEKGLCIIRLEPPFTQEGQAILETMILGLEAVSQQYPEFVRMTHGR